MKITDLSEWGRVVKDVNTTVDVGVDEIRLQAAKFNNTVSRDGVPPTLASNGSVAFFNQGPATSSNKHTRNSINEFVNYCKFILELDSVPQIVVTTPNIIESVYKTDTQRITVQAHSTAAATMHAIASQLVHYKNNTTAASVRAHRDATVFASVMLEQWQQHSVAPQFTAIELAAMEGGLDPNDLCETIRKQGGQYAVYSKDGSKQLGSYTTRSAAEKRLRQIEYFKHRDNK
jgi:hypothetical protein